MISKLIPDTMKMLVANSMRIAADDYDKCAADAARAECARMSLAFETQAKQARALADAFEGADEMLVSFEKRNDCDEAMAALTAVLS